MNQAMKQFFNIQQNSIVPTSVNVIEGNKYMYECETFFSVDYKTGFGGEFGVQGDRVDKSALGWEHHEDLNKHESQTDYAKGFGGKFGVQTDRIDKNAHTFEEEPGVVGSTYQKTRPDGKGMTWSVVDAF